MKIIEISSYKRRKGDFCMCKILKKIQGKSALELLEQYGISTDPPIDLSILFKKIGISTMGVDFSEIEQAARYEHGRILGAAISKGDNLTIFYRKEDTENGQRFTIAHELAHCCLHSNNLEQKHIELRENQINKDQRELAADIFAGELLIPPKSLDAVYKKLLIPSLSSLARIFKVSSNVMAARLDYLSMAYMKDTEYTNL